MNIEDDKFIERFLRNELSSKEKEEFLYRVSTDVEFKANFLLEKEMFMSLNEEEWNFIEDNDTEEVLAYLKVFESDEVKQIKKNITNGLVDYKKKQRRGKLVKLFSGAAAAIIIFLFVLRPSFAPISDNYDFQSYADVLLETNLPTFTERGDSTGNSNLIKAEKTFKERKYQEAVNLFGSSLKVNKNNSAIFIYTAISYLKLNENKKAFEILDDLISSNLIDAEKGYWYQSLFYLKLKQEKKAKKILELIVEKRYFKNKEAKQILEKL